MNRISTILLFACVFLYSACIKDPVFDQIQYVNTLGANIDVKKVSLNGEYCVEDNGCKNTWECAVKVGLDSLLKDSWIVCSKSTSDDFYKYKPSNSIKQFAVVIEPNVYDTTYYYCAVLRKGDKELAEGEIRKIYFGNPDATIVTIPVTDITDTSAACGGIVNYSGNTSVTARGVCWSTSHNPTINGPRTTDGSGTGNFSSAMTGLSPNTTYYVRAYATNSAGTAYGEEREFATLPGLPTVTTSSVSNITTSSATCGGNVTNDGNATVTARGLCWSTSHNPTISDSHTTNGSGTGSFTSSITGLSENTTYHVRAYATNSAGTAYGEERTFTTTTLPTVTTSTVSSITTSSATCGGNVTNDGNTTVTARGICWSTSHNPTISNSHTTNGNGTGSFTGSMTGLSANTTYYVRAYATNSVGTAYGEERTFTTTTLPTVTTSTVSSVTSSSATCGGNVTNDGNTTVTARGICWSTSHNPTISGSHTTNGSGTGNFTSSITGLSTGTTYYVRAYATNSAGTAYGEERTFTTLTLPTVTTSTVSSITTSSATCGGNVTNDGNTTVTARGVCWSTSHNPTISSSHTTNGSGTGYFSNSITGLAANTTYYVRAYATNSVGTAYGEERTFTTLTLPTVTTSTVSSVTYSTATCGGNVTNDGNTTVTARGVCWSTSHNPTISDSHTTNGSGTGSFTSSITGLSASTTYYVRAYATNSVGIAYGDEFSFATTSIPAGWVDLGLPSGLLWAKCNLGATTPEGYGNYYAWGETSTKSDYSWSTYRYGSSTSTLTKYCSNSSYGLNGFTDNLTTLEPSDDAATIARGSRAHIPTSAQWQELFDNTTAEWTRQNGVYGCKFTAANGNSLFLPAAGSKSGSVLYGTGEKGIYMTSSRGSYSYESYFVRTTSASLHSVDRAGRPYGQSVRAVLSTQ